MAQRLRAEMGYELKERVEVLSEAVRAKMRVVTSKWCNGLLTASFNSYALCRLFSSRSSAGAPSCSCACALSMQSDTDMACAGGRSRCGCSACTR